MLGIAVDAGTDSQNSQSNDRKDDTDAMCYTVCSLFIDAMSVEDRFHIKRTISDIDMNGKASRILFYLIGSAVGIDFPIHLPTDHSILGNNFTLYPLHMNFYATERCTSLKKQKPSGMQSRRL